MFVLLLRMLLRRPLEEALSAVRKFVSRFDKFATGQWCELISSSNKCAQEARSRRRRRTLKECDSEQRAARALKFVQLGELSAGKQALSRAELAPRNTPTLDQLRRRRCATRTCPTAASWHTHLQSGGGALLPERQISRAWGSSRTVWDNV